MFLIAGLCFCAWTDQKWGRVSNEALMLLSFVGVMEWGMGFITGALPFLLFGMLLFRFRVMGAGDGKLMAVIGGYLGQYIDTYMGEVEALMRKEDPFSEDVDYLSVCVCKTEACASGGALSLIDQFIQTI